MYTSHGHHISGTTLGERPSRVARCGGVGMCRECSTEAGRVRNDSLYDIDGSFIPNGKEISLKLEFPRLTEEQYKHILHVVEVASGFTPHTVTIGLPQKIVEIR